MKINFGKAHVRAGWRASAAVGAVDWKISAWREIWHNASTGNRAADRRAAKARRAARAAARFYEEL